MTYLKMIEDNNGDLVDVKYYHDGCAPEAVRLQGSWPAPSWPDYNVHCERCDGIMHRGNYDA